MIVESVRLQATTLLHALGNTPNMVRDHLQAAQIDGIPNTGTWCPIGEWLTRYAPLPEGYTWKVGFEQAYILREGMVSVLEINLPLPVQAFLRAWESGELDLAYPPGGTMADVAD